LTVFKYELSHITNVTLTTQVNMHYSSGMTYWSCLAAPGQKSRGFRHGRQVSTGRHMYTQTGLLQSHSSHISACAQQQLGDDPPGCTHIHRHVCFHVLYVRMDW